MSNFAAAPQALGYLFQIRYALLTLLEDETLSLRIEALDDIEIVPAAGGMAAAYQLKHRADGVKITDASVDLWKTLRVWATGIKSGDIAPDAIALSLVSTASAEPNSIASLLRRSKERNAELAHKKADDYASKSKNATLATSIAAYESLSVGQKTAMFNAITVHDGSLNIDDARKALEAKLAMAVARQFRSPLADRVEGWWFKVCVEHLLGTKPLIAGYELFDAVTSLASQFSNDSLPIDCYAVKPDSAQAGELKNRAFVAQLEKIGISAARIQYAVLDYYRAFTQRSRWVKDHLLIDDELERYEDKLFDEWNRVRLAFEDKFGEHASDHALVELGKNLLDWAEQTANIRIRPQVSEAYVMRGSFHMLADQDPPRIKWHRNFASTIKAAIIQANA